MDIGLPRLDGIAATQQIKTELPNVTVVMLTSHTTERKIIASLSSGADAYGIKDARLLKAIAAAAERLLKAIALAISPICQKEARYLAPQIARQGSGLV
jgi:NarL family two-component system response regulator LiaR